MWIYMLFPYAGACLAALFYKLHEHIDKNEYKQNQPVQFVGLMVNTNENSQIIQTHYQGPPNQYMMTNSQIGVPQHAIPHNSNSQMEVSQERSQVWQQLHNNGRISTEMEKVRSDSHLNNHISMA